MGSVSLLLATDGLRASHHLAMKQVLILALMACAVEVSISWPQIVFPGEIHRASGDQNRRNYYQNRPPVDSAGAKAVGLDTGIVSNGTAEEIAKAIANAPPGSTSVTIGINVIFKTPEGTYVVRKEVQSPLTNQK